MKVIAIMDYIISPISTATGIIKEGKIYTVIDEYSGYSTFAEREVETYALEGIDGLFEKGIFVPLSDFGMLLNKLLHTKPINKKLSAK